MSHIMRPMPKKPVKEKANDRIIVRADEEIMKLIEGAGRETRTSKASLVQAAIREFFNNHTDIDSQILACGRNGGSG